MTTEDKNAEGVDETVPTFVPNTDMSVDGVKANLAAIALIDVELGKVAGTIVAKQNAAKLSVETDAQTLAHDVKPSKGILSRLVDVYAAADALAEIHPMIGSRFVADIMSDLETRKAKYDADADGLVRDILKATSATSETTVTLSAQRDALSGLVKAMSDILKQLGTDVSDLSVPTPPKVPGLVSTTTTSKAPKVTNKSASCYVVKDGNRQTFSNDSLSYLAFRFGIETDALEAMLAAKGIDRTKAFETTLAITGTKAPMAGKSNTWTFGQTVTDK